jgi:hypothetical protein
MASDSAKFSADFSYVRDKVNEFFRRRTVQRAFGLIDARSISGWERWWQVEFAIWLSGHDDVGDCFLEVVFNTDLRRNTEKDWIALDIGFRLKGFSRNELLFLELKQNSDWRRCIENMLLDVEKVYSAQKYSVNNGFMIRNFFVLGAYPTRDTTKKEVHDYVQQRANELNISIERGHLHTKFVQNSPYSVTMF